jgi:hypothetical protein
MNRRYIRIAANQEKIAGLLFEQQLISTVYGVTRLYIDLASLRDNVRVKEEDLQLAEWLKREVVSRVGEGILPSIEVTRASASLLTTRQALINARALLEEQEAVFKSVLFRKGLDDAAVRDARVVPTDALELPKETASLDASKLVAEALASRPDLLQAGLQAENTRISLEGSRNNAEAAVGYRRLRAEQPDSAAPQTPSPPTRIRHFCRRIRQRAWTGVPAQLSHLWRGHPVESAAAQPHRAGRRRARRNRRPARPIFAPRSFATRQDWKCRMRSSRCAGRRPPTRRRPSRRGFRWNPWMPKRPASKRG